MDTSGGCNVDASSSEFRQQMGWHRQASPWQVSSPSSPSNDFSASSVLQGFRLAFYIFCDRILISLLCPSMSSLDRSDNAIKNRFNSALKKIHGPPSTPAAHNNNNSSSSHLCCSSITGFPFLVGVESLELLPNMETQMDPNQISYHSAGSTHSVETFNIINTMADFFVADCSAADNDFTTMQWRIPGGLLFCF